MPDTPAIVGFVELDRGEDEEVQAGLDMLPGAIDRLHVPRRGPSRDPRPPSRPRDALNRYGGAWPRSVVG